MTKLAILLTFYFLPFLSFSQKDTLITFTEIVITDSISKEQLFQNARQWYNKTFVSSKEVLQILDKETGELSGKGIIKSYYDYKVFGSEKKYDCYFKFNLDIRVKEGKYKYTFSNFVIDPKLTPGFETIPALTSAEKCPVKFPMVSEKKTNGMYISMQKNLETQMTIFIAELKKEMNNKPKDDF
jgi:Domain of unknown function (DUF4468) with TBP-like fold